MTKPASSGSVSWDTLGTSCPNPWRTLTRPSGCLSSIEQIYGDPARVMAARKRKLSSLGSLHRDKKNSRAVKKQVEWLMKVEVTLKEIIELAQEDEEMENEAYNGSMISTVRDLFPFRYLSELTEFKGSGKEKLLKMVSYIENLRENRQEMMKGCEEHDAEGGGADDAVDEMYEDTLTDTEDSIDEEYTDGNSVGTDFGGVDDLSHPGGDQPGPDEDSTEDDDTTVPGPDLVSDEESAASVSTIL